MHAGAPDMGHREIRIFGHRRIERRIRAVQGREHAIDAVDIVRGGAVRGGCQRQAVAVELHLMSSRIGHEV